MIEELLYYDMLQNPEDEYYTKVYYDYILDLGRNAVEEAKAKLSLNNNYIPLEQKYNITSLFIVDLDKFVRDATWLVTNFPINKVTVSASHSIPFLIEVFLPHPSGNPYKDNDSACYSFLDNFRKNYYSSREINNIQDNDD